MKYQDFLDSKSQYYSDRGIEPIWVPDFLYDFQKVLVDWSLRRGRGAIFADCGLGKTPMQLVWAENIVRHTNRPVLIVTPLAVSYQLLQEAEKFGLEATRIVDGKVPKKAGIIVTNYQRLQHFDSSDFAGVVCDESSILKNFNGTTKAIVTELLRPLDYRLLCTATAAPNDYIELGTSSEALGELGHMDMLSRFFKNDQGHANQGGRYYGAQQKWRFKGHAEEPFWKWVSSWARAIRKPSDYGFDNDGFILPKLTEHDHIIETNKALPGMLFDLPAVSLQEQRDQRRMTIDERCDSVAELVDKSDQALVWCHLNDEGNKLSREIKDAVQVSGSDSDDVKEERLLAFANGEIRVLVTKPKIGAWGLNLQRCAHITFFPSHSYEQYYQGIRRCWRFGQKRPVKVDIVSTQGEEEVMKNLRRKALQADRMFDSLLEHMQDALTIKETNVYQNKMEVPAWL